MSPCGETPNVGETARAGITRDTRIVDLRSMNPDRQMTQGQNAVDDRRNGGPLADSTGKSRVPRRSALSVSGLRSVISQKITVDDLEGDNRGGFCAHTLAVHVVRRRRGDNGRAGRRPRRKTVVCFISEPHDRLASGEGEMAAQLAV